MDSPDSPDPQDSPAPDGSPHSAWSIALRLLLAALVAGGFYAIDRIWLQEEVREQFGAKVKSFEIESQRLERTLPAKVVVPKGAPPRNRRLVVFLHGRGEDERSYLVEPMFEALSELSAKRAPVVAFPFGGDSSYWHNRESGAWASYVLFEAIPQIVDRFDIDPDRVAIGGISMGGYGAFNVARLDPDGFCAVAGHSPAIWETAGETADGAFDDADDFERNDIIDVARSTEPSPYAGIPLWLDAGEDDPFLAGNDAFEAALRAGGARPVVKRSPGSHDSDYWDGNWEEYFRFYARALEICRPEPTEQEGESGAGRRPEQGESDEGRPERASGSSSRRSGEAERSSG